MITYINSEELKKECRKLLGGRGGAAYKLRKWCEMNKLVCISPSGEYIQNISSVQICAVYCLLNGYFPTYFPLLDIDSDTGMDIYHRIDSVFPNYAVPLHRIEGTIIYYAESKKGKDNLSVRPYLLIERIEEERAKREKGRGFFSLFTKYKGSPKGVEQYAVLYEQILLRLNSRRILCAAFKLDYDAAKKAASNSSAVKVSSERRRRK